MRPFATLGRAVPLVVLMGTVAGCADDETQRRCEELFATMATYSFPVEARTVAELSEQSDEFNLAMAEAVAEYGRLECRQPVDDDD